MRLLLAAILTVLTSQSVYAADTCQAVFRSSPVVIDNRVGHVGQNDQYFDVVGLSGPGASTNLCGPTSIANGLVKIHSVLGLRSSLNTQEMVERLVRRYFDANLLSSGTDSLKMKRAIGRALADEHLSSSVHVFSNSQTETGYEGHIREGALRAAVDADSFVIAGIGRYNARRVVDTNYTNRVSAHYVLVVGYNPHVPSQYFVVDPLHPGRVREVEIITVMNPDRMYDSIRWRFVDGLDAAPTILLEDVIVTKARKP